MWDVAGALLRSGQVVNVVQKGDGDDLNGVDENGMDTDSKRPNDLPRPNLPADSTSESFLFGWWCVFWDIFGARQTRSNGGNGAAMQYVQQTQVRLH
jgi:hypothetical protein